MSSFKFKSFAQKNLLGYFILHCLFLYEAHLFSVGLKIILKVQVSLCVLGAVKIGRKTARYGHVLIKLVVKAGAQYRAVCFAALV